MKKYSFLILSILLISCSKNEEYFPLKSLNQIDGFWKASSNLIYINSKDSTLTFNKLKKHKLKAKLIDSNFILIGKNQYGDESFNGIIRINNNLDKIEIKRRDNHFKFLIGSKFIYNKVNSLN
ncbi:MAG: hypothetical protein CL832_09420 [Crocinitomicaceae bacterium]|nr:hypothetical protein [Crocinitomicaceae bacterium]|tara:strand:- start:3498 stop:3866 length:369 start_codon:yes stop_codon:yes gene_type:complete